MTLLDLITREAARLKKAGVSFGHGTANAFDEAAWLVLWSLGMDLDSLEEHAKQEMSAEAEAKAVEPITRRIESRLPAAYLTREAWLQNVPFYVDERVIVGHGREGSNGAFLKEGIVEQTLEHRRGALVTRAHEGLERFLPLRLRGVAVGEDGPQLREHARIPEPHRHDSRQATDRRVGIGVDRFIALLPRLWGPHPSPCRERRDDFLEHPFPRGGIGAGQSGHQRLVAGLLAGGPADDEPRHRRDPRVGRQRHRTARIERHQRLDGIPIHEGKVVVAGILGMGHEAGNDTGSETQSSRLALEDPLNDNPANPGGSRGSLGSGETGDAEIVGAEAGAAVETWAPAVPGLATPEPGAVTTVLASESVS
jgi:hypothetical protein